MINVPTLMETLKKKKYIYIYIYIERERERERRARVSLCGWLVIRDVEFGSGAIHFSLHTNVFIIFTF